jgi:hypothetical protein
MTDRAADDPGDAEEQPEEHHRPEVHATGVADHHGPCQGERHASREPHPVPLRVCCGRVDREQRKEPEGLAAAHLAGPLGDGTDEHDPEQEQREPLPDRQSDSEHP